MSKKNGNGKTEKPAGPVTTLDELDRLRLSEAFEKKRALEAQATLLATQHGQVMQQLAAATARLRDRFTEMGEKYKFEVGSDSVNLEDGAITRAPKRVPPVPVAESAAEVAGGPRN